MSIAPFGFGYCEVACPGGTAVLGGGGQIAAPLPLFTPIVIWGSSPLGSGWQIQATKLGYGNGTATPVIMNAWATCLEQK